MDSEEESIARHEKAEAFGREFKALVRKFCPEPFAEVDDHLLVMMQDRTSCYSPYIWSD